MQRIDCVLVTLVLAVNGQSGEVMISDTGPKLAILAASL